ncbi:MAG: nitroreductase [bacterium]|nr:nitroreductase [bacterium]
MELKEAINKRHSVRNFRHEAIPIEVLKDIVSTAERVPSWENSQPWNVYIAVGETLKKIKAIWAGKYADKVKGSPDMPTGHRTNFSERSQQSMRDFMGAVAEYSGDPEIAHFLKMNEELFNAPALVYLTLAKGHTGWPIYDLGGFGLALMLAAKEHGVDSIPAYEIVKFPAELRPLLSVPEDEDIIMGIALGYAADDSINDFTSTRLPLEDILTIRQ